MCVCISAQPYRQETPGKAGSERAARGWRADAGHSELRGCPPAAASLPVSGRLLRCRKKSFQTSVCVSLSSSHPRLNDKGVDSSSFWGKEANSNATQRRGQNNKASISTKAVTKAGWRELDTGSAHAIEMMVSGLAATTLLPLTAKAHLWQCSGPAVSCTSQAYGSSPCCLLLLTPSNFPSWGLPKSPQRPEGPKKLGHRKWAGTEKGRICQQQDWGLTKHSWISPPVFHSSVWTSVHRITWHPHSAKLLEVPSSLRRRFPSLRVSWSGRPARLSQALLLSNHLQKAQFCLQLLWGEESWWEFTPQKSDVGHSQAEACSGLDLKQWLCFFKKHAGRLQEDVKSSLLMLILTWSAMNTTPRTC